MDEKLTLIKLSLNRIVHVSIELHRDRKLKNESPLTWFCDELHNHWAHNKLSKAATNDNSRCLIVCHRSERAICRWDFAEIEKR